MHIFSQKYQYNAVAKLQKPRLKLIVTPYLKPLVKGWEITRQLVMELSISLTAARIYLQFKICNMELQCENSDGKNIVQ
jgi:hypothetical protein